MRSSFTITAVVVILSLAFGLYRFEHRVQRMEGQLGELNRGILAHHQAIQVLRAEWSYLNRPDRLQRLAGSHLELVPLLPSQIGRLDEIPVITPKQVGLSGQSKSARKSASKISGKSSKPGVTPLKRQARASKAKAVARVRNRGQRS